MLRRSRPTPEAHPDGRCCCCHAPQSRPAAAGALLGVTGLLLLGWLLCDLCPGATADPYSADFGTSTCSCRPHNPQHPQMAFCASDFALKVHVHSRISSRRNDRFEQYWIQVKKVYRNSLKLTGLVSGRRLPLWLAILADTCGPAIIRQPSAAIAGQRLRANHSYLVTGKFEHGKLLLTKCSWISYWPNKAERAQLLPTALTSVVSRDQSRYLRRGYYARNCARCTIEDKLNGTKSRHSCVFDSYSDYHMCMAVHAHCGRYTNKYLRHSECDWQAFNVPQFLRCASANVVVRARINP